MNILVLSKSVMSAILHIVFLHLESLCCLLMLLNIPLHPVGNRFCDFSSVLKSPRKSRENKKQGVLYFSAD